MSIFDKINPLEPLLWIEGEPLLTLTFLWHLSQEDIENKKSSDLLWKLTRQLFIAIKHKDSFPIQEEYLQKQLQTFKINEIISSMIESKVITEETLIEILKTQEVYFAYLTHLRLKTIEEISNDDSAIHEYYENEERFTRSNVFEVYQAILSLEQKNIESLEELKRQATNVSWLGAFTIEELDEYTPGLILPKENELPITLELNKEKQTYLFIEKFHTSYKPTYEKIKDTLVIALAENSLEFQIEEEVQTYLEKFDIKYNEEAIKTVFQLDQII